MSRVGSVIFLSAYTIAKDSRYEAQLKRTFISAALPLQAYKAEWRERQALFKVDSVHCGHGKDGGIGESGGGKVVTLGVPQSLAGH